jgi:hypothetical protein
MLKAVRTFQDEECDARSHFALEMNRQPATQDLAESNGRFQNFCPLCPSSMISGSGRSVRISRMERKS